MGFVSVVIDGPAGVGKSTLAKAIALELGYKYIDTGAMYRAATLLALENNIPIDEHNQQRILDEVCKKEFIFILDNKQSKIFHGVRDLTEDIRSLEVTRNVSYVAALPLVRKGLRDLQRKMAACTNVVMEGRDIGTVVLPDAKYKFFLVASSEIRTRRRLLELANKGLELKFDTVLQDIKARDKLDSTRAIAPLSKAADAVEIDTSHLDILEVKALILSHIN